MQLERYTADDFCAGTPLIYYTHHCDEPVTVKPIALSGVHQFDGGRELSFKFQNGYFTSSNIDGCELTNSLWKGVRDDYKRRH